MAMKPTDFPWVRCVTHGRWMHRTAKDCGFDQPFKTTGCSTERKV